MGSARRGLTTSGTLATPANQAVDCVSKSVWFPKWEMRPHISMLRAETGRTPPQMSFGSISIVCTANTCRSPVLGAWLRHELDLAGRRNVEIWTAGLTLDPDKSSPRALVKKYSLAAARELGMGERAYTTLERHKAALLERRKRPADCLCWITDLENIQVADPGGPNGYRIRMDRITARCERLGAALIVVPVSDTAWLALRDVRRHDTANGRRRAKAAYLAQSDELRRWARALVHLVPIA
jgi:hypothetical protein